MKASDLAPPTDHELLEVMARLSGNIAHDFNNLLSPLIGYTDLSWEHINEPEELEQCLTQLRQAGQRAQQYARRLLYCSGRDTHQRQLLNAHTEVQHFLNNLHLRLPENINLNVDIQNEDNTLHAAPEHLHQILEQLCNNALRAMPEGGTLSISIKPQNNHLQLSIEDTGHGMSADTAQRAFEPYFADYDKHASVGLGLAIVRGITHSLGGQASIYSQPGQGTQVTINLPTLIDDNEKTAPLCAPKTHAAPSLRRILLVDDDTSILRLTKRALHKHKFDVDAFDNAQQALDQLNTPGNTYDLLVTDHSMPTLTGLELTRQLRLNDNNIPVIICSGHGNLLPRREAHALGIRAFIAKPVTPDELALAIEHTLGPVNTN